jgi:hypothetical protein
MISPEHLLLAQSGLAYERSLTDALGRLLDLGGSLAVALQAARQRLIDLAIERSGGDRVAAARLLAIHEDELTAEQ